MNSKQRFDNTIHAIDLINAEDPNKELVNGQEKAKELVYSERMTEMLLVFNPDATENMQIAARAQHIKRWAIARDEFDMNRTGYLKWRSQLKLMHAKIIEEIMVQNAYEKDDIKNVKDLILKKQLKTNENAQELEDVVCLVFLKYYFKEFSEKHSDEKLIAILQKTWGKMSDKGHKHALVLEFDEKQLDLIKNALG